MDSDNSDRPRLIEVAFPLKQTSMDSSHEKLCHAGHPKAIHIWPARRPLAACRATLIATLIPDPGDDDERKNILEKLGGRIVEKPKRKKRAGGGYVEELVEETEGGILHWGRESGPDLEWFRQKISEEYGGRPPKVLDPFAGGGAIPLEAMRLGCEATAVDINPVAWFILKCTLEYPQKLAGQTRPLPDFVLKDRDFMESFYKAQGFKTARLREQLKNLNLGDNPMPPLPGMESETVSIGADLAWHVRAWGWWVLREARRELSRLYPTYAVFEPSVEVSHSWERRPIQLVPLDENGIPGIDQLNSEFPDTYQKNKANPRWVAKTSIAYLWARAVICKNCRAVMPLLKSRWLAKKDNQRVLLKMSPNNDKTGVVFDILNNVPLEKGSPGQRREHDKKIGSGTMSRSGATCPCCGVIMTMEDIRLEGQAGRLQMIMTSVVYKKKKGKQFRKPTPLELSIMEGAKKYIKEYGSNIPYGLPSEPTPVGGGSGAGRAFSIYGYGLQQWQDLFTDRQIAILLFLAQQIRKIPLEDPEWREAILVFLTCVLNKIADYNSTLVDWQPGGVKGGHTFMRWALPIKWDFVENNILESASGGWAAVTNWISSSIERSLLVATENSPSPKIHCKSALKVSQETNYDLIITDPPYYDAIPYSDLMDFFYVWLRRTLYGISPIYDEIFSETLTPKWDREEQDGELIDDETRHDGDRLRSKQAYEDGMSKAFMACHRVLKKDGRFVVVFAHKDPTAWDTLVSAIIKTGFIVNGSWPIQTEMSNRTRSQTSAALSSSVWLVCKKRSDTTQPGWDNRVLEEMRHQIISRLREFWDAGIRGPDFVWAATGPALEVYSKYPAVKKANEPGQLMTVDEFLGHVRRIVVNFVVGRVLTGIGGTESVSGLDNITTYYLLHRHDFGFEEAQAGACILYAISCGLSDRDLTDKYNMLSIAGKPRSKIEGDDLDTGDNSEIEYEESSGSTFRLKGWRERKRSFLWKESKLEKSSSRLPLFPDMESSISPSREVPLIDHAHRLMHLWKAGDINQIEDHLDIYGLRSNQLFHQLLQALIELATVGSEERSLLESISNHMGVRGKEIP